MTQEHLVTATITEIGAETATLDAGGRPAILPLAELGGARAGESLEVWIDSDNGQLLASKEKADRLRLWHTINDAAGKEGELDGEVIALVKGGLAVDVGIRAFLPASQAELRHGVDLAPLVGQRLRFRVVEFNRKRGNVVLSRRALLEAERTAQKEKLFGRLVAGDVLEGTVKSFVQYGAFIDLGGVDGLLHVSDMSWGHVPHPSRLLAIGQSVRVKVLDVDTAKERIALGMKQLTDDPWSKVPTAYAAGTRVKATVLRLTDFGAFVELEPAIEGLVHASQMSWSKRPQRPADIVKPGDEVEVVVLDVDAKERRISLGMRQLLPNPWQTLRERYRPGAVLEGRVRSVTEFGVFVGIEDGIDGLVHASDMSWTERVIPAERYKKGDQVQAVVLDIDPEAERVALGIKQLTDDPWQQLAQRLPSGSRITGRVTRLAEFGAFIEVEPGIEGLCHVSEMGRDEAKEGEPLTVVVLEVDPGKRRIALSAREASAPAPKRGKAAPESTSRFSNTLGAKLAGKLGIDPKKS